MNKTIFKEFLRIPVVGKSIAQDLWDMGLKSLDDLKNANVEDLYLSLCKLKNTKVNRCMLYVLDVQFILLPQKILILNY